MKSYSLPNGLVINHANVQETSLLYEEIFLQKIYMQHGINLPDHAVVFDGGANIGLFSLFVLMNCPGSSVHAFEPAPQTFALLKANTCSYKNITVNNCGLGSEAKQELFTYLPMSTTGSGYYDEKMLLIQKERLYSAILEDPIRSQPFQGSVGKELLEYQLDEAFKGEVVLTPVRSLSDYIDENRIDKIDLVKIDVECRECAVLAGIREDHWSSIQQLVIETHSRVHDSLPEVLGILDRHGFSSRIVPEAGRLTTMVYAKR